MPDIPTLAATFRAAGYQAYAAGKLHVFPQRNRIGFDDVALAEEGRAQFGVTDDYEAFLGREGYAGQSHMHGLSVNGYEVRPWHLPEYCHPTNWTTAEMMKFIKRRDPTRPAFWYLSYNHPHPPLAPLAEYLQLYDGMQPSSFEVSDWAKEDDKLPGLLVAARHRYRPTNSLAMQAAQRAFYALCTHIDHQLRLVIGTLREEGLLDNTVILFTSDHGDMLGHQGFWSKRLFYEPSARIPMLLIGTTNNDRVGLNKTDERLVGLQDVMPTLLDLAGIPIPSHVTGRSMLGAGKRESLYGELGEGIDATRMIREGDWKLIYYPEGNQFQLFHVTDDPAETRDLSGDPKCQEAFKRLQDRLAQELYGQDKEWIKMGEWLGLPKRPVGELMTALFSKSRHLAGQRGDHWPPPSS